MCDKAVNNRMDLLHTVSKHALTSPLIEPSQAVRNHNYRPGSAVLQDTIRPSIVRVIWVYIEVVGYLVKEVIVHEGVLLDQTLHSL